MTERVALNLGHGTSRAVRLGLQPGGTKPRHAAGTKPGLEYPVASIKFDADSIIAVEPRDQFPLGVFSRLSITSISTGDLRRSSCRPNFFSASCDAFTPAL